MPITTDLVVDDCDGTFVVVDDVASNADEVDAELIETPEVELDEEDVPAPTAPAEVVLVAAPPPPPPPPMPTPSVYDDNGVSLINTKLVLVVPDKGTYVFGVGVVCTYEVLLLLDV